jgi:hypothetical protein
MSCLTCLLLTRKTNLQKIMNLSTQLLTSKKIPGSPPAGQPLKKNLCVIIQLYNHHTTINILKMYSCVQVF